MKARMSADVQRFAKWEPAALEQRIAWRMTALKQAQQELVAMRKAQRIQRKAAAEGVSDEKRR